MLILHWNPLTRANHNQWNGWPRVFFHSTHVALGVPACLVGRALHLPIVLVAAIAIGLALIEKCIWVDWHRTSGGLLHWTGWHITDWPDFWSDLGLTLIGAFAGALVASPREAIAWCTSFYVLSTFNGT